MFLKFISFLLVFTACAGTESSSTISEEEIQSRIDSAVEMALIEAEEEFNKKLFKATSTTTTLAPTTTTLAPTTTTTILATTTTTLAPTTTTSTTTTTIYLDNEPPVWSDDPITFSRVNTTQLDILWGLATDNISIKEYKIYANDVLVATVNEGAERRVTIYNLTPNTQYNFEILACDDENNCSIENPKATKLTLTPTTTTTTTTTTTIPPTTTTTMLFVSDSDYDYFVNYSVALGASSNVTINLTCPTPTYASSKQELVGNSYPINKNYPDGSTPRGFVDYNPPTSYDYTSDGFNLVSLSISGDNIVAVFTPISQEVFDSKGGTGEIWHRWQINYTCEWTTRQYP